MGRNFWLKSQARFWICSTERVIAGSNSMKICVLYFAALVASMGCTAADTVFHVAPTGSDLNPGTRSKPFATLERARL